MIEENADIQEALREARALLEEWRGFPDSVHVWCAAGHDLVRRTDAVLDALAWAIDEPAPPPAVELATYESLRAHLLDAPGAEGSYAVIRGGACLGVARSYEDALELGYRACGLAPFLVKKVERVDTVHRI